jgi:hypothetical protein
MKIIVFGCSWLKAGGANAPPDGRHHRLAGFGGNPWEVPGATYGRHLVLGQWGLAEVHSRTVTLYMLTTMAVVVGGVWLGGDWMLGRSCVIALERSCVIALEPIGSTGRQAILGLAIVTALSRLMMFAGLQKLGSVQIAA